MLHTLRPSAGRAQTARTARTAWLVALNAACTEHRQRNPPRLLTAQLPPIVRPQCRATGELARLLASTLFGQLSSASLAGQLMLPTQRRADGMGRLAQTAWQAVLSAFSFKPRQARPPRRPTAHLPMPMMRPPRLPAGRLPRLTQTNPFTPLCNASLAARPPLPIPTLLDGMVRLARAGWTAASD